jgi:uncharacterized protein YerC
MVRVKPSSLLGDERKEYLDILWTSISNLNGRDSVKNFFKDLLSESESIMLGRRLAIAKDLLEGQTYEEIREKREVGLTTIGSVQNWLTSGFAGYEKALIKYSRELNRRKKIQASKNLQHDYFSFSSLKKRYPMHFLLFNMFDEVQANKTDITRHKKIVKKAGKKRKRK